MPSKWFLLVLLPIFSAAIGRRKRRKAFVAPVGLLCCLSFLPGTAFSAGTAPQPGSFSAGQVVVAQSKPPVAAVKPAQEAKRAKKKPPSPEPASPKPAARPAPEEKPPEQVPAKKPVRPESEPDFAGIELGPGILHAIQKRVLITDWTQKEIDAYYKVLAFARRTDERLQKQKARENILHEVQQLRKKIEEAYRRRLAEIDQRAEELGAVQAARQRAFARQRRNRQLRQCEEYERNPETFPIFAPLFIDLYQDEQGRQRSFFRGKLVTLHGTLRRLLTYPPEETHTLAKKLGIRQLHEAWLYTDDAGKVFKKDPTPIPVVVICTELPEGIPQGENLAERVSVTGYVFRMHYFKNREGEYGQAPMILAARLEWHPRKEPPAAPLWLKGAILSTLALILLAVVYFGRRDKAAHRRRIEEALAEETPPPVAPPEDASSPS